MSAEFTRLCYNMNHKRRGHCIIFNHENFIPAAGLGKRTGTNYSRDMLKKLFSSLGFTVKVYNNLTLREVQDVIRDFAVNVDHTDCDALVVVFMSHGEKNILYASDKYFHPEMLFVSFEGDKCPSLAGKPKIFFIEADRGDTLQNCVRIPNLRGKQAHHDTQIETHSLNSEFDALQNLHQQEMERSSKYEKQSFEISSHADFLVCYGTPQDCFTWRNTVNGSWFSQALVKVLERDCEHNDLLSMMTTVNHYLTTSFKSNTPSTRHMHDKKQVSCFHSTLTKKVYLTPKKY